MIDLDRARPAVDVLSRLLRVLQSVDAGISFAQFRFLIRLRAGGERSARLAKAMSVQKPTITALADGLIAAGLVTREREGGDRRTFRLVLTDAGRATLERAETALAERLAQIVGGLDDPHAFLDQVAELGAVLDVRSSDKHGG